MEKKPKNVSINPFGWIVRNYQKVVADVKSDMKQDMKYKFKAINPVDFELTLNLFVSNSILLKIFDSVKGKYGINDADASSLERFVVPKDFHNLLKTNLEGNIKKIKRDVECDHIKVASCDLTEAYFQKDNQLQWRVFIIYKGTYIDERTEEDKQE